MKKINSYQRSKARRIAGHITQWACKSGAASIRELPVLVARFTPDNWRTVSFEAGVPVADEPCKIMTVALLLEMAA